MAPLFVMRWVERAARVVTPPPFDPRDLAGRLAEAADAGAAVRFVDVEGRDEGAWSTLLLRDALILAAVIARYDYGRLRRVFDARRQAAMAATGESEAWRTAEAVVDGVRHELERLESWREAAALGGPRDVATALHQRLNWALSEELSHVAGELEQLRALISASAWSDPMDRRRLMSKLGTLVDRVERAFVTLAQDAEARVAKPQSGADHPPAQALHVIMAELLQTVQQAANALPSHVRAFHRRTLLAEPLRPARMDRVQLVLSLPPGATGCAVVPAGARFAAKDSAGNALIYAADHPTEVTSARIGRIRATRTLRGPRGDTTGVLETELLADKDGALATGTPLYGGRRAGELDGATRAAPLGLVVCRAELAMSSGRRTVRLAFDLSDPVDPRLETDAGLEAQLSTAAGWRNETGAAIRFEKSTLRVDIDVPAEAPPLTPPPRLQDGSELTEPAVRLQIRSDAPPGSLQALAAVRIVGLTLQTSCDDLAGVKTRVGEHPAADAVDFYPFGSPAYCGGAFEVLHSELDDKPLTDVSLSLAWANPPTQRDGFAGYYAQYVVGPDRALVPKLFDTEVFKACAAVSGGQAALIAKSRKPFDVFSTTEEAGEAEAQHLVSPVSDYHFELSPDGSVDGGPLRLRIALTAPRYGFGEDLFVTNLIHASTGEPPQRRGGLKSLLERIAPERRPDPRVVIHPNPPWRPTVSKLRLGYRTERRFGGEELRGLFALGSFGAVHGAQPEGQGVPLVRLPDAPAQLAIELLDVPPGAHQRLLMTLEPAAGGEGRPARLSAPGAVLRDETDGLTRSGAIVLRRDLTEPPPPLWLEIRSVANPSEDPALVLIGAHSLVATRVDTGDQGTGEPLAAGSIKAFLDAPPTPLPIVSQPWASIGGRKAEIAGGTDPWLAERLRHKGRADTPWDYERLALDSCQTVTRVRALSADGSAGRPAGTVTVVVQGADGVSSEEREALAARLGACASAAASVRVVAPAALKVMIDAEVLLEADVAPARLAADIDAFLQGRIEAPSDLCGAPALTAALKAFAASRPYVRAVLALSVRFGADLDGLDWAAPTGGEHRIFAADLA